VPDTARRFDERPAQRRSETERDRDRILYSSAFNRLGGITQVAAAEVGSVLHNRLTHSLKVAQVARRLAQALRSRNNEQRRRSRAISDIDEDAVEAAALAHDVGHPPFGHVAEEELNGLAARWGGFEGNAQSFRIVTRLALRERLYDGLNLTRVTLNGVLKYPWLRDLDDPLRSRKWGAYGSEREYFEWTRNGRADGERSLEAEIMDWADDVTYAVHDLEDFYRLGLIPLDRVAGDPTERGRFFDSFFVPGSNQTKLRQKFADMRPDDLERATSFLFDGLFRGIAAYDGRRDRRVLLRYSASFLIGRYIGGVRVGTRRPMSIPPELLAEVAVLKELAWFYIIDSAALHTLQYGQRAVIRGLHEIYEQAANDSRLWKILPRAHQEQLRDAPDDRRTVTDLVARLTEDLAFELHRRLTGVSRGSLVDAAAQAAR
jgi:dGTPase